MNVLVTGGAGFIGSKLIKEINFRFPEWNVFVYDNFSSGSINNLRGLKYIFINSFSEQIPRFDLVYHLAFNTDTTNQKFEENKKGVDILEKIYESTSLRAHVIAASSASVYGNSNNFNVNSVSYDTCLNMYAFQKLKMEKEIEKMNCFYNSSIFRFFNVYDTPKSGAEEYKGSSASMVYQIGKKILSGERVVLFGDGNEERDFVYVGDVVNRLIKAAFNDKDINKIQNLGTGRSISFNEIVQTFAKHFNVSPKVSYTQCPYEFFQKKTCSIQGSDFKFMTLKNVLDKEERDSVIVRINALFKKKQ